MLRSQLHRRLVLLGSTYREFAPIFNQSGLESVKCRLLLSKVDDEFGCQAIREITTVLSLTVGWN